MVRPGVERTAGDGLAGACELKSQERGYLLFTWVCLCLPRTERANWTDNTVEEYIGELKNSDELYIVYDQRRARRRKR